MGRTIEQTSLVKLFQDSYEKLEKRTGISQEGEL